MSSLIYSEPRPHELTGLSDNIKSGKKEHVIVEAFINDQNYAYPKTSIYVLRFRLDIEYP